MPRIALALAAVFLVGCRPGTPDRPLADRDPVFVIPAVKGVAEESPRSVAWSEVTRLVELLDSEDAAVRLASEQALRDLSGGRDFGYRFWADADDRAPAVARWREWAAGRAGP